MKTNLTLLATALGLSLTLIQVRAEANYVYHERTGANPGCGGQYVTRLNPTSAETYPLRFKVEYQFWTDNVRVYYTTDGSTPTGAFGVPSGTTAVVSGSYVCTFGGPVVDVVQATIPAQPAGTVVKYIVSAWHSGGGDEIFANGPGAPCGCGTPTSISSLATVFQYTVGSTTNLYWDVNGPTAGAGGATPTGTWDGTATNWSTTIDGTSAGTNWVSGRNAIFSAGTNATGAFTVTVSGTQTAGSVTVEEGDVTISGGSVSLGGGNVTVNAGAVLGLDNASRVATTPGSTLNINGGTIRNTNPGGSGTFFDADSAIVIGPLGATFSYTSAGLLSLMEGIQTISGTGGLTKEGAGILAIARVCSYDGPTIINNGTLRVRTSSNRLPTTTDVFVTSSGVLDPGSSTDMIQTVNSINASGNITFSANSTLRIAGNSNSTISGVISDGTAFGRISKAGNGTLTLTGNNTYDGRFTNDAGVTIVAPGAQWMGPLGDTYINGGTVMLSNSTQLILSLAGDGGEVYLAPGHTLIVSNSTTKSYLGAFNGPGSLVKTNIGLWNLMGASGFTGNLTLGGGIVNASNSLALGSSAGHTDVLPLAELRFDGAGINFACAEPIRFAGGGAGTEGAVNVRNAAIVELSGPLTLTSNGTITVSSSASAALTHPASITALGNFTLTLQGGANTAGYKAITGVINLGAGGLTKLQSGEWILGGANLYSGLTAIGAGTLTVTNTTGSATGSGSVVVSNSATLGGNGIVAGPVSVLSGGTLSPGGTNIATLTLDDNVTLAGSVRVDLNKSLVQTSDQIAGINTLTAGGTINATNSGPALAAGDTFTVFVATAYTGSFSSITPTTPGAGLAWDLPHLNTTGVLRVHANPVPGVNVAEVVQGATTTIPVSKLLANATGEPGETLSITAVTSPTPGGGTASLGGGFITYTAPSSGTSDTLSYTLNDGRGGTATGTVSVTLTPSNSQGFNQLALPENIGPNTWRLSYVGIPGYNYALDWRTNLTLGVWVPVATNTAGPNGVLLFTNVSAEPANFYRTRHVP